MTLLRQDKMASQNQKVLLDTWSLQADISAMEQAIQEWDKKIVLNAYKPIYETLKNRVGGASKKLKIIEEERTAVLTGYVNLDDALKEAESQNAELTQENLLKSTIQALKAEIAQMKKEIAFLLDKNQKLSQKLEQIEEKYSEKDKELHEKKLEVKQANEDQDMIILGDFAYQFQNLLAKVCEQKGGVTIGQVEEMIESNNPPEAVDMLRKSGIADKKVLKKLERCLYAIKDARNLVGHKAIKPNMAISFDEIEKLAQRHFLFSQVIPIIQAWKLLMKSGEIFDMTTWVLID